MADQSSTAINLTLQAEQVRPGDRLVRADSFMETVVMVEIEPRNVLIVTDVQSTRRPRTHVVEVVRSGSSSDD